MPKRKASSNGYYELKSDLYSDIKLERRRLDYDMPMHFHRNLEFQYIESGEYRTVIDGTEYAFGKDEIACGFESIPSFYRAFNHVFSMTPKEYFELEKEIFW